MVRFCLSTYDVETCFWIGISINPLLKITQCTLDKLPTVENTASAQPSGIFELVVGIGYIRHD